MKKNIITLTVIAALSMPFIANAEVAPTPDAPMTHGDAKPMPPRPDMKPRFKFSPFEGIKLTEEQKTKIEAIHKEDRSHMKKDMFKEGFAAEKRVRDVVTSDDYSKDKVEKIVREATEKLVSASVDRADQEHKIFEVLNPEQKKQYKENISKFEDRMKDMQERREKSLRQSEPKDGAPLPPPSDSEAK